MRLRRMDDDHIARQSDCGSEAHPQSNSSRVIKIPNMTVINGLKTISGAMRFAG